MKKCTFLYVLMIGLVLLCSPALEADAREKVLQEGIYFNEMDLKGMTKQEAAAYLTEYVEDLKQTPVTLITSGETQVQATLGECGIYWKNTEILDEAVSYGSKGTLISRYKQVKDLQRNPVHYTLEYDYDINAINRILIEKCSGYDREAKNASLSRSDGEFQIVAGQTGYLLDVESSIDTVYNHLKDWQGEKLEIALDVQVDVPKADAETLAMVKDVLGTFTTSFTTSSADRSANVTNGCNLINGTTLYPGEEFSTYQTVSPFSVENGYYMAGSYMNGKVVDSLGGGICQVSTTLYNAVLLSELEVTERHNHSMIVTYVSPSADAAIAESAGKDFRFKNNTDYPIYIEGIIQDRKITFNIYGVETRDTVNREVIYESKTLETINPTGELLYANAAQPFGYLARLESAHVGKKAQLWKIVKENGVEVSREQINSSSYKMSPASYSVGVVTTDANAYEAIIAAINTGSVDMVRGTIAAYTPQAQ